MSQPNRIASAAAWLLALLLPAVAAAQTESIVGYLPVAGSTPGNQGSNFKTSLRILNPNATPIAGRIVFHPAGRSADAADPSIEYALAPEQSLTFDDVAAAIGVTGLGSLDVTVELPVPPVFHPPVFVARIFNDAGTAGTSGFTAPLFVPAGPRPDPPVALVLLGPILTDRFRFNVGVQNLGPPVDLTVEVLDPSGAVRHAVTRTYAEHFFQRRAPPISRRLPARGRPVDSRSRRRSAQADRLRRDRRQHHQRLERAVCVPSVRGVPPMTWTERILEFPVRAAAVDDFLRELGQGNRRFERGADHAERGGLCRAGRGSLGRPAAGSCRPRTRR